MRVKIRAVGAYFTVKSKPLIVMAALFAVIAALAAPADTLILTQALTEKGFSDSTANQETLSYIVANNNPSSPATSFALFSSGVLAPSLAILRNWTFSRRWGFWIPSTLGNSGMASSFSPPYISVILLGGVSFTLLPTKIAAGNGSTVPARPNRGASWPVTEPDALAVLGMALVGAASLLRRRLRSQAHLRTISSRQAPLLERSSDGSLAKL